jgi:hypothetical protein
MLQSIKQICGNKLGASDGEIGCVKDLLFDAKHWAVRYVVADTGSWLPGRQVLLSPHAFGRLPEHGKILPVFLTRKQIEDSPAIESHKPVSRQYEEEYYRFYGWPYYWQGDAVWGLSGFPILTEKSKPYQGEAATHTDVKPPGGEAHLWSAQSVMGYQVEAADGITGSVTDFMMDDESWIIAHLVVNTGNRFSGKKILLSPSQVDRISWDDSKVFVNLTKDAVLKAELAPV